MKIATSSTSSLLRLLSPSSSHRSIRFSHSHCVDVVKTKDYHSYLVGLLLPSPSEKQAFFAVKAFTAETIFIKESIRDKANIMPAKLKMQWWRDRVDDIYTDKENSDSAPNRPEMNHPIVSELSKAVNAKQLTRRYLEKLLNARDQNLSSLQFETVSDVEMYCEQTLSSSLYLDLEIIGLRESIADHVASHLGISSGIAQALKNVEVHGQKGEISIPRELTLKHNVISSVFLNRNVGPQSKKPDVDLETALRDAVFEFATTGNAHMESANDYLCGEDSAKLSGAPRSVFLCRLGPERFYKKLEEVDFNVFDERLQNSDMDNVLLQMKMLKTKVMG